MSVDFTPGMVFTQHMTSTQTTRNRKAERELDAATSSLAAAEELRTILHAALPTSNDYVIDAYQRAVDLVVEMNDNLDDVMSRFSLDECGL